jgi:hypothetical protein
MNKVLIFRVLFLITIVFACKKDRSCVCSYDSGNKSTFTILKKSKKDAKNECESYNGTIDGTAVSCQLD